MDGMKSCSSEYKAFEPRKIINKKRLVRSAEKAIEQEYNYPFFIYFFNSDSPQAELNSH